jgi:sugar phosphate isomerase/epimerase
LKHTPKIVGAEWMFKNLSPAAIGVSGRQSELIELALTFGFRSLEVNIDEFVRKAQNQGIDYASRFLASGHLKLGCFELPIAWHGTEDSFKTNLQELDGIVQVVAAAGGSVCYSKILPASDVYPYHENFEIHRKRLSEIAERLSQAKISMGLLLQPLASQRDAGEFQFIDDAEGITALIKSISSPNLGLYLDIWSWRLGGGTTDQIRALGRRVVGLNVADAPADVTRQTATAAHRLLPGAGVIDNVGLIRQLSEQGFKGPVTLAVHNSCFKGMSREGIVQKCSALLDELLTAAGVVARRTPVNA